MMSSRCRLRSARRRAEVSRAARREIARVYLKDMLVRLELQLADSWAALSSSTSLASFVTARYRAQAPSGCLCKLNRRLSGVVSLSLSLSRPSVSKLVASVSLDDEEKESTTSIN